MDLASKLRSLSLPFSLQSSDSVNKILINRPNEPKSYIDAAQNGEMFSKILYHAFKEATPLRFCVLNLIHHLRDKNTLELEDFEKHEIFFADDPIDRWSVTYFEDFGGIRPNNIACLVLVVSNNQLSLAKILEAYFFHKNEHRKRKFFIPIEYIQSILFEE